MKILFFSHYFPPEGNAPASRTHENCKRWVREGHEVKVITGVPNCPEGVVYEGYRNRLCQQEFIDGIDVRRVWTYIAANKGVMLRIINYVSYMVSTSFFSLFTGKPDVIIATSPQFFCGWAGVLSRCMFRRPLILEIRDIWPESIVTVGAMKNSLIIRFLERLEKIMYASACHIVTVGAGYRKCLVKRGVNPGKISVVMNGVNRELFHPRTADAGLKKKLGIENKFICMYSGTIGMACGLDVVLDAAEVIQKKGIDDIVFLLVGDGASRKELELKAKEKMVSNVIFTGRQSKSMMPEFLAISDVCLVHLRKTELFKTVMPSKIFEMAGMAKPIINGVSGEAADFIERAQCGINIEPGNSEQLIAALIRLQKDAFLRTSCGKAGFEFVIANFDRDKLAVDYLKIIDSVVRKGWLKN